jgi:hypothetical protein
MVGVVRLKAHTDPAAGADRRSVQGVAVRRSTKFYQEPLFDSASCGLAYPKKNTHLDGSGY